MLGQFILLLRIYLKQCDFERRTYSLFGIIPGPHEPSLSDSVNTYLRPLVDDLDILWKAGIYLKSADSPLFSEKYRCALLCISCDIPASRKAGGFLARSARKGCNKCLVNFPSCLHKECDRLSFLKVGTSRTDDAHRLHVAQISKATTKQERQRAESEHGVRFSEFLRLPYYKPIQFLTVDPMHNLFLGTAKGFFKDIWTAMERVHCCQEPI